MLGCGKVWQPASAFYTLKEGISSKKLEQDRSVHRVTPKKKPNLTGLGFSLLLYNLTLRGQLL